MARQPVRVYADTSVFGGVFDDEFSKPSRRFFDQVSQGRYRLVISPLVEEELVGAPERVRELLDEVSSDADIVPLPNEATELQARYLAAGIVSEGASDDALHVAIATVTDCSVIVSWNFRHIVHFSRIPLYNGVNASEGYRQIAIHAPSAVIEHEDEEV